MADQKPYEGPLAEPIVRPRKLAEELLAKAQTKMVERIKAGEIDIDAAVDELMRLRQEMNQELNAYVADVVELKKPFLFQHYGIDEDSATRWQDLALQLATAHVPGFAITDAPEIEALWQAVLKDVQAGPHGAH
jgi:hypothetical protein